MKVVGWAGPEGAELGQRTSLRSELPLERLPFPNSSTPKVFGVAKATYQG